MGNRLEPRVFGNYGDQKTRPNQEIETMVGQLTAGYGVGADYRISTRLVFQVDADKLRQDFEEQQFRGALVNRTLNRTSDSLRGALRMGATPITTFVLGAINTRDRFEFSSERDAESLSLTVAMETKPSALIAGSASVGYRRFNALDESVPDNRGPIADVAVGYTLLDRTRFGVNARRNLEFSAERVQPYYILTSLGGSITQMIGLGWDVRVGGSADTLAYRNFVEVPIEEGRSDTIDSFNFGFGRKVGDIGRVGLEVGHVERRSPIETFAYDGWRAGVKITYGN
jgi:Putative beta-barrel porin 2